MKSRGKHLVGGSVARCRGNTAGTHKNPYGMASCLYSCLGCARNQSASASAEDDINAIGPTVASSTLPTYRQIAGAGNGAGSAPARRVPVLFSTNRGLYLRVAQPQVMLLQPLSNAPQHYDISFCDLERWSTNRANVVSLEDTISMLQPQQAPHPPRNNFGLYNMQR
ncbi:uncharacterized protein LOC132785157 [Drosophila nasuta]|uniref:uncharacterized protein LOC132785157 n=1 Tax=Drosophila nasuta TaxID=42062 RepID=UPI00295EAF4F|nr:uncharacterized protein LOC132785157 [Drosophila nasuta]